MPEPTSRHVVGYVKTAVPAHDESVALYNCSDGTPPLHVPAWWYASDRYTDDVPAKHVPAGTKVDPLLPVQVEEV